MRFLEMVFYIIIIAGVLWLSYYVSRMLSNNVGGFNASKYVKHLDRLALSKDTFLSVVQIGDRYMLLGVSADKIEMLKELEENDLKPIEKTVNAPQNPYVEKALEKIKPVISSIGASLEDIFISIKNKPILKGKANKIKGQGVTENTTGDMPETKQHSGEKIALKESLLRNKSRQLFSRNASQKNAEYDDEIFNEILKRTATRANKLKQKTDVDEGSLDV